MRSMVEGASAPQRAQDAHAPEGAHLARRQHGRRAQDTCKGDSAKAPSTALRAVPCTLLMRFLGCTPQVARSEA